MASNTSKAQRIFIFIIAFVMLLGTLGAYLIYFLMPKNQEIDKKHCESLLADYREKAQSRQDKIDDQNNKLSDEYYPIFSKYADQVKEFTADSVEKLSTTDLKIGTGTEIKADTAYGAYYIGWRPDGYIFDQSIDGGKLKAPLGSTIGFITGWSEGVIGMKLGGIRLLSIPSDKAYGEDGSGDKIPANTPLKFIVMAVEIAEAPKEVPISDDLYKCYAQ